MQALAYYALLVIAACIVCFLFAVTIWLASTLPTTLPARCAGSEVGRILSLEELPEPSTRYADLNRWVPST